MVRVAPHGAGAENAMQDSEVRTVFEGGDHDGRVFDVFYRDYVNNVVISSGKPEPLDASRIAPLAEVVLQHADNFFGIVDGNGLVLQAFLDDDEQTIWVELLFEEGQGALRLQMPWQNAIDLLRDLPNEFSEKLLPGAQFINA